MAKPRRLRRQDPLAIQARKAFTALGIPEDSGKRKAGWKLSGFRRTAFGDFRLTYDQALSLARANSRIH